MDISDLYWLAGLLEGEGCFALEKHKGSKHRGNPRILVNMTDMDIILRAAKLMCGDEVISISRYGQKIAGYKVQYKASISGDKARKLMILLYPILGTRRQAKIKEIIEDSIKESI